MQVFVMEEFEASDTVARLAMSAGEEEVPNLKHSCTPSTYKGVGQQVEILNDDQFGLWCSML